MQDISFLEVKQRLDSLDLPDFDLVIGIARGGIVPASLIAYKLGCELEFVRLNYRDDDNNPLYAEPVFENSIPETSYKGKKILLVDDVGVSGKTLNQAKQLFEGENLKTLIFKGKNADFVLFPDIKTCVNWKWKLSSERLVV